MSSEKQPKSPFIALILGFVLIGGGSLLGGALLDQLLGGGTKSSILTELKEAIEPELASGHIAKDKAISDEYMVVAAHPVASQIGAEILDKGGNALDAAIATQIALNLVEPQSSGIGGGAFMLYWDNKTKKLYTYDGRETAPAKVDLKLFENSDGTKKDFMEAVVGGASVGVPGVLQMFDTARSEHGGQSLASLFEPTIELAENGFPVSPRLNTLLSGAKYMKPGTAIHDYFFDDTGKPLAIGTSLKNPAFANSLRKIAKEGIGTFYAGSLSRDIIDTVRQAPNNPGNMSYRDMLHYEAKLRPNLCMDYRGSKVCGMPPPSSGGLTVLQILGILENTDIAEYDPLSIEAIQTFAEAMRLSHADRDKYIADSDFTPVPSNGMINSSYLKSRSLEMDMGSGEKGRAEAGVIMDQAMLNYAPDVSLELPSTTHIVIIDKQGNAVSMTSSIETAFGSHQMVGGFILNNQLTDFSSKAEVDGKAVANRIEPNKRPRSSMAPTMVFDDKGELKLILGSPGGSSIIGYVAKSVVAVLDWKLPLDDALAIPHYMNKNYGLELEEDTDAEDLKDDMEDRGYKVRVRAKTSGLHAIMVNSDGTLTGAADPRREGVPIGNQQLLSETNQAFQLIEGLD